MAPPRAWHPALACSLVLAASLVLCRPAAADDAALAAVRASIANGRYADAVTMARALAASTSPTDPGAAAVRQLTVEALLVDGRGAEPDTLTVAHSLIAPGAPPSVEHATRERLLGLVLTARAEYAVAATHVRRALREHERLLGSLDVAVADDLDALVDVLIWLEEYPAALAASDRAVAIRDKADSPASRGLARTLELRGLLFQRRN